MKVLQAVLIASTIVGNATGMNFRGILNKNAAATSDPITDLSDSDPIADLEETQRRLQCDGSQPAKWHPTYSAGWSSGYCRYTKDCNSPGYGSELACCKGAYSGQTSGYCLSRLPNPPTTSPTGTGGLGVYYPDYATPWSDAYCISDRPLPNGRPTYSSMLSCCKGAYAGQMSGKCLNMLPSPPTSSPTKAGGLDVYYADYATAWSDAGCINDAPMPSGRPTYATQLACCKGAYAGQMSGKCLSMLPSPPTTSPTGTGGYDFYSPDYESPWDRATCKNERPLPFATGGRPTYSTQLACCKGAYAGQQSGACLASLPSPPTQSPTTAGGLDAYYPNYLPWAVGTCINERPLPNGRPSYSSKEACCKGNYGSQTNNYCMCQVDPCYSCNCGDATFLQANDCLRNNPVPVWPISPNTGAQKGSLDCGFNEDPGRV